MDPVSCSLLESRLRSVWPSLVSCPQGAHGLSYVSLRPTGFSPCHSLHSLLGRLHIWTSPFTNAISSFGKRVAAPCFRDFLLRVTLLSGSCLVRGRPEQLKVLCSPLLTGLLPLSFPRHSPLLHGVEPRKPHSSVLTCGLTSADKETLVPCLGRSLGAGGGEEGGSFGGCRPALPATSAGIDVFAFVTCPQNLSRGLRGYFRMFCPSH